MPVVINVDAKAHPSDPETITILVAPNADADIHAIDFGSGGTVGIRAAGSKPMGDLPQGHAEVIITEAKAGNEGNPPNA